MKYHSLEADVLSYMVTMKRGRESPGLDVSRWVIKGRHRRESVMDTYGSTHGLSGIQG